LMYRAKNDGRIAMILCSMMVVNLRVERFKGGEVYSSTPPPWVRFYACLL
jgi:hypothetical protein